MSENQGVNAAGARYIQGVGSRVEAACQRLGTRTKAAQVAGLSTDQLLRIVRGDSVPNFIAVQAIAIAAGVSLHWIATGEGPMLQERADAGDFAQQRIPGVPIIGLSGTHDGGWFFADFLDARASRPSDFTNPSAFAVMAPDRALSPVGVHPGFLCYCDPAVAPDVGDIVYAKLADGRAALRTFAGSEQGAAVLESWRQRAAGEKEPPEFRSERIGFAQIKNLAPVVYVKRKL